MEGRVSIRSISARTTSKVQFAQEAPVCLVPLPPLSLLPIRKSRYPAEENPACKQTKTRSSPDDSTNGGIFPTKECFTSSFALLDPAERGPVECRDMADISELNMAVADDEDAVDEDGADDE